MSYPPPPGLKTSSHHHHQQQQQQPRSGSSTPQPHPSLPARPPPSTSSSFRPAFSNASTSSTSSRAPSSNGATVQSSNFNSFAAFKPRSVATSSSNTWRNAAVSTGAATASSYQSRPTPSYPGQQYSGSYPQASYGSQQDANAYGQPTPPQIHNPFPAPNQSSSFNRGPSRHANQTQNGSGNYDPEMEAQIAQWQSAYMSKSEAAAAAANVNGPNYAGGANAVALGPRSAAAATIGTAAAPTPVVADTLSAKPENNSGATVKGPDGKEKTVLRSGGGETWSDSTLLEWDPAHFRLFVGNLAGEVTDDSLLKAFSKYGTVVKARVIRDKRTTKSKGYGFVSFADGDDYFQAAKEMQGKYIGSHPVLVRRATTEVRPMSAPDKNKHYQKGKGGDRGGGKGPGSGGHANTGAGVSKKQSKTKGGLKILG